MIFRLLLLVALLGLSACNGSDSKSPQTDADTSDSTFADLATAKGELVKVNAAVSAAEQKRVQLEAERVAKAGKPKEGAELLKTAGLKQEAADMLKSAGLDEDAYKLFAPEDYKLDDKTKYNAADIGQLPKAVDEAPAVKRHKMTFADSSKTPFWYTASAGHLTAYDNNLTMKGAKASIFYTAYTRDDLPKENRPVTFFFNGGPGEASIWLHMGGFAPKYVQTNEPIVPAGAETKTPRYKLLDDEETLLDKSDLVFVDPVGTGYSQAIKPHTNKSFWGTDVDSKILRDFIVRYTNVNNRQSSPKYLYGESYGGFRAPIVAKLLTDAGTSVYEADTSGRKTVVLTGFVLHSPILDFRTNCSASTAGYCAGLLPTYAMTADFFHPVNKRQTLPIADYAQSLRNFVRDTHKPNVDTYLRSSKDWTAYKATAPGLAYLSSLQTYADVPVTKWANNPNMKPDDIMGVLKPGYTYNVYDARMTISNRSFISPTTGEPPYHFSYIEDDGIKELFKDFRPDFLNYSNTSYYTASASVTSVGWVGSWDWGAGRDRHPSKVQTHAWMI